MAEPTSVYTYRDLVAKIAHEAGVAYYGGGTGRAMVPVDDDYNLQLCKDIVNDGIKMFIADCPPKGWRWMRRIMSVNITGTRVTGTVDSIPVANQLRDATLMTTYTAATDLVGWYAYILTGTGVGSYAVITAYDEDTGTITVVDWLDEYGNAGGTDPIATDTFAITQYETVGGDIARYPLAENFGGSADGPIEYAADTNHSSPIEWCDESLIRAKRSVSVQTGYPLLAAIRPLEPVGSTLSSTSIKRRWELFLDPQPSATDVLTFPYTLYFDKLDVETGTASAGAATSLSDTARTEGDDYFNGWKITIIYGTGKGSNAIVTDYTGATGKFDVADWLTDAGAAGGTDPDTTSVYAVEPLNNRHPAGQRFDEAVYSACKYKLEEVDEEVDKGFSQKYMQKDLPQAKILDGRGAPRKLGSLNKSGQPMRTRVWNDVTTSHDV